MWRKGTKYELNMELSCLFIREPGVPFRQKCVSFGLYSVISLTNSFTTRQPVLYLKLLCLFKSSPIWILPVLESSHILQDYQNPSPSSLQSSGHILFVTVLLRASCLHSISSDVYNMPVKKKGSYFPFKTHEETQAWRDWYQITNWHICRARSQRGIIKTTHQ